MYQKRLVNPNVITTEKIVHCTKQLCVKERLRLSIRRPSSSMFEENIKVRELLVLYATTRQVVEILGLTCCSMVQRSL